MTEGALDGVRLGKSRPRGGVVAEVQLQPQLVVGRVRPYVGVGVGTVVSQRAEQVVLPNAAVGASVRF